MASLERMSKSGYFYRVQAPLSRRARRAELFQSARGVQAMPIISSFSKEWEEIRSISEKNNT